MRPFAGHVIRGILAHMRNPPTRSGISAFLASTLFAALLVAQFGAGCSSSGGGAEGSGGSSSSGGTTSSGGQTGSGGSASGGTTGSGGKVGSGGATGSGGSATGGSGSGGKGSGGSTGSGGTASGGTTGPGGATATGGGGGHAAGGTPGQGGGTTAHGGQGGRASGSGGMDGATPNDKGGAGVLPQNITLTSTQVTEGSPFPAGITCADSSMGSPDLTWTAGPSGTMSYAVTLTDLTNSYVHWAIWNIPPATTTLPAKLATTATLTTPAGGQQLNAFSGNGYYGPCPSGSLHYYQFRVYALGVATLPGTTPTTSSTNATASLKATIIQNAIGSGALTGTSNATKM